MNISMVGIDFHTSSIEQRERYALTKEKAASLGYYFIQEKLADGCVVLITCNRVEIWFSGLRGSPKEQFFKAIGEEEKNKNLFVEREGDGAIHYLMELGCGIHSQIFGEDQILTQMKQAMRQARENKCIDAVLETVFRQAVTAAKKVKTSVRLTMCHESIPFEALKLLTRCISDLREKKALIIGNGEMGRMMAELLVQQGLDVTMTLRQYKTFDAVIPDGVGIVLYEERYEMLPSMDIVVSATRSPHYTVQIEKIKSLKKKCIFMDLAVPRDIDPEIGKLKEVELYDIDSLEMKAQCDSVQLEKAERIIETYISEVKRWYACREIMPDIQYVGEKTGKLIDAKLTNVYQALPLYKEDEIKLKKNVQKAVEKSMVRLILSMREQMDENEFKKCMEIFVKSVNEFPMV